MNEQQKRLLVLMEFKFYELQIGREPFTRLLSDLGLQDPRDSGDNSLMAFLNANAVLRQHLRSTNGS